MGHLNILLIERSQSGDGAKLGVPITYDIWEKANHEKGEKSVHSQEFAAGLRGGG